MDQPVARPSRTPCTVRTAWLGSLDSCRLDVLDEGERNRRARYRIGGDRDRFTLATALLRVVVGEMLLVDPSCVPLIRECEFCGGAHGRPRLPGTGLEASITHSGDLVAVAITAAGRVGVDVERVTDKEVDSLVRLVCTAAEERQLRTAEDFYRYWTRKEAVLKALGEGLRAPMPDVVVAAPDEPPAVLAYRGGPPPPCRMADVDVAAGYAGAVAVLTPEPVAFAVSDATDLVAAPDVHVSSKKRHA